MIDPVVAVVVAVVVVIVLALVGLGFYLLFSGFAASNRPPEVLRRWCPYCQTELEPMANLGQTIECPQCGTQMHLPRKSVTALIWGGYICACIALLCCPPLFGLAGTAFGIANISRGETGHGTAQIILSILFMLVGMVIGAILMTL